MTAQIDAAVRALRAGGIVAFPTETVYGLGADARSDVGVRRVFELKGRPRTHPLIVHLLSMAEVGQWGTWTPAAQALAGRFWPGPLTLVLTRAAGVSDLVTGGQSTVALRVPAHPVAQQLLAAFGGGIAAPSANRFGRVSPTCAAHVRDEFGAEVPLVLDGGDSEWGLESAIVDCSGETPTLLRPGSLGTATLRAVVPDLAVGADAASPRVPGSTPAHYAPCTPLQLVPGPELAKCVAMLVSAGQRVAVLARRESHRLSGVSPTATNVTGTNLIGSLLAGDVQWLQGGTSARAYAHALYANLRTLDRLGYGRILVEAVPDEAEWDAVRDRLRRAAAGTGPDDNDKTALGVMP